MLETAKSPTDSDLNSAIAPIGNATTDLPNTGLPTTSLLGQQPTANGQIAFVDSGLKNVDDLIASLTDATVYLIDAQQDGISVISNALSQRQQSGEGISSVHIFTHGDAGELQLGATTLTADNLTDYGGAIASWGNSETGDILLYGCDVAKGETGNAFINQFAALTGADIQASNDITGSSQLGGDWDLEVSVGSIESAFAISQAGQASYLGTLGKPRITTNGGRDTATVVVSNGTSYITDVNVKGANGFSEGSGIEYYFWGGNDSYLFDIDVNTGIVSFKDTFNANNPTDANRDNIYDINILAIDWTQQYDQQAMSVKVNSPSEPFEITNRKNISVNEGSTAVTDFNVTGAKGGFNESFGVEYYFYGGNDSYLFNLNNKSGVLSFKDAPSFESPADANRDNSYDVRILAVDYTGQQDIQSFNVSVKDGGGNPGGGKPRINSNGGKDSAVINVNEGSRGVTNVNVAGGESDITYSLNAGDDAGLFNINRNTGVISFKNAPDFENPRDADRNNVYFANVLAQNSSGKADSQFLSVVVNDVAESGSSPVITSNGGKDSAYVKVQEGNTLAVDMSVTDADGQTEGNGITYSMNDGEDRNLFNINANTGKISFKSAADYETARDSDRNNIYRINVLATDSTGRADSQFIQVEVTNKVSVYLLGGQSNMAGDTSNRNFLNGKPEGNPLSDVQIWSQGTNSYVDLQPGFNGNFGGQPGFGAEIGFGHSIAAAQANGSLDGEEAYLIKYAVGATSLAEDWNVDGGDQYDNFTQWVGDALANLTNAGVGYDIEGMLWMQGENDAFDEARAASYQDNLTDLVGDVRRRYGADMDFVIGRLHEELTPFFYSEANVVRAAQANVANASSKNYLVNTDDLPVNTDGVHFTSAGHLRLGEKFADVFTS